MSACFRNVPSKLCLLLGAALILPTPRVPAQSLSIRPHVGVAGDSVRVPILVSNVPSLAALALTLNYDPQLLTLTGVRPGPLGRFAVSYRDSDGSVRLAAVQSAALPNANGALAVVEFTIKNGAPEASSSLLTIADRSLSGAKGRNLEWSTPVVHTSGSLTVVTSTLDADADGLPDAWEDLHFGAVDVTTGTEDSDGDGASNYDEYLAGTDPLFAPPNQPPILPAIANRSVPAGHQILITNLATDANVPAQRLTFSLDAPIPAGASVGAVNGIFSWTPTTNQIGVYALTMRVTDSGVPAMSATQSFTIVVSEPVPPSITCPANLSVATSERSCASNVTFSATCTANCVGVSIVCVPPSGSPFAKGANTVVCTATDAIGSTNICAFTITVRDEQPPIASCPANLTVTTSGSSCSSNVTFAATASDNCPGQAIVCSPASGSSFAKGTNTVVCTATDASGNTNLCAFTVTVRDEQPPIASCPANLTVATSGGSCSSNVTFAATASDNCPGQAIVCSPASGSTFAKGTNTVVCTATDASGNTNLCAFTVTVRDEQPPVATCPANLTVATSGGSCASNVTFAATASDNCPGQAIVCSPASGSSFAKGTNTVVCTATDASGNTNLCAFTITVRDEQPPVATCPANIIVTTSLDVSASNVTFSATASDNCPGQMVICQPPSGSAFPRGVTTVACTATDTSSNTNTCTFTVTVLAPPLVGSIALTGTTVTLSWTAHPGQRYRVENTSTLLAPTSWTPVGNVITATSTVQTLSYPGVTNRMLFYRVVSLDN